MPSFQNNQRISLKQNPTIRGVIDLIYPFQGGYQFYDVKLDDGSLQNLAENELMPELIIQSPWELLETNRSESIRYGVINFILKKVMKD